MIAALAGAILPVAAHAQAPAVGNYSSARIADGSWTYVASPSGGEARFVNSSGQAQLLLTCTRATRQIAIARPSPVAAPMLQVWASNAARNLPAAFNPATRLATATLPATDPLLDALALSRGRLAVAVGGQPAIVPPAWGEITRVVEECRL